MPEQDPHAGAAVVGLITAGIIGLLGAAFVLGLILAIV